MWSVQVVGFAAAATIDIRGERNKLEMNLSACVRNSPELHEGARHTPRVLAERDTGAGGATGGHCLWWIRLGYFTPQVAALLFSWEEG